ncbi:hypothetical protein LCGC14_1220330 [marine sediment metagenome]|uniref:Uncharacterized protein n=1 Tax=marine sediment metagenome TaxID=412755 RepID=A0A0F9PFZ3_9ZZZZ
MIGKRIYPNDNGDLFLSQGDYGQQINGEWFARPPNCHTGSLKNHEVTEHDDGTITVNPSIFICDDENELYHGYLKHGEWKP